MSKSKTPREYATDAAIARCDLNTLYAVIAVLEGGTISGRCSGAISRIIRECKKESGKCLNRYDRALAHIGDFA